MTTSHNSNAILYSLLKIARTNGLESYLYFKRVFTEFSQVSCVKEIEALLRFPGFAAPEVK